MAFVTLKKKIGGTFVPAYPETTLGQVTDISTVGANLAGLDKPATVPEFIKVNTDGSVETLTESELRSALAVSPADHGHPQGDITDLATTLLDKADLSSGKIIASQIPDYLFSGMRKMESLAGDADTNTLEELYALLEGANDTERSGGYFVVGTEFALTFSTPHVLIGGGDEGTTTSGLTIEAGDWLVFVGDNAGDKEWAVINNTYRAANTSVTGVVKLSNTAAVTRNALSAVSSSAKVMDESKVRQVMKDIFYGASEPAGALDGDIWFDGTF